MTASDLHAPLVIDQIDLLVRLGVPGLAGIEDRTLCAWGAALPEQPGALVVVHPNLVPASQLAGLMRRDDNAGFVVMDMTDLDEFTSVPGAAVPDSALYLAYGLDRGDDLRNRSPDEAAPVLAERGRSPLTISEGISAVLQEPAWLHPGHCFMCIGSRRRKPAGTLDSRTPAIWISSGTGRDGSHRRGAPKIGWCWAANRHTWLGFASATVRTGPPATS